MTTINQTKRIVYLGILRFVACLGVILIHVSDNEFAMAFPSFDWNVSVVYESLVHWAVPIFVMVSGALFLNPSKTLSIEDILKKYIPRLLFAYIFWWLFFGGVNSIGGSVQGNGFVIRPSFFLPQFHLWFLPMLACVYLLMPVLRMVANNKRVLSYILLVGGAILSFRHTSITTMSS